ncbi:MAG: four helix bundle protein [Rhodothermales bacterium]|jgi:four helix bundle protein
MKDLKLRTKEFALRIIRLHAALPSTPVARTLGNQLLRSGTSVGAHYREACRARSTAEFVSKLGGGHQELEETSYWLELLVESKTLSAPQLGPLIQEADELSAIFTTCTKNAKNGDSK